LDHGQLQGGLWHLRLQRHPLHHESPIRGEAFVTRKITRALARIKLGLQDRLYLGNLDAKRDWGHARDYVCMQWLMLPEDHPEDSVIATGRQHSVRAFVQQAAREIGYESPSDRLARQTPLGD